MWLLIEYKFLFLSIFSALVYIFIILLTQDASYIQLKKHVFYELEWTLSEETILHLNLHIMRLGPKVELVPEYKLDDIENYVNSFNWFENWFRKLFFTKFSDYILVVLIVSLIFYLISSKKKVTKLFFKKNKN